MSFVAPGSFGGTLTADAIAAGWRRAAPGDEVVALPLADGGPDSSIGLHAALAGSGHRIDGAGSPLPAGERRWSWSSDSAAAPRWGGVRLVLAADVDNPPAGGADEP